MTEETRAGDLPESVDAIVVGAGHNGLVCAGYLAAAGLEVLVLEARDVPGGDTVTEELTLPGFAHDSCSSAHVLIQSNPLIRDDELGLIGVHGLEYAMTDPAVVLPQPGGETLVMHRDLGRTADEIARWSRTDAEAFRRLMGEWSDGLAAEHARWSSHMAPGDAGGRYQALRRRSAWDVVHERFEHPVIRSFLLWLSLATIQDPRRPGTGVLPPSITAGRVAFGWTTPVGGSSALPAALIRQIQAHGGRVACSAPVSSVDVEGGRAVAVRTSDGRRVRAREAVVSSAHLARLADMISGADAPADLAEARRTWRPGLSVFAVHAALRRDIAFPGSGGPIASAAAGFGTADGIARQMEAFHRGEPDAADPWLLVVDQTVVDPGRAPGGGATFKILTVAPYERADGRSWEETKDEHAEALIGLVRSRAVGLAPDDILALRAESPVDVAAHNMHNLGGSCHGGEFLLPSGEVIPGWLSYRSSIPGLFLTGATTHPGGSVSGRPGRNAARTVLTDLGIDPAKVMGPL
ncbi:FAD-dependent oxidoreductase [Planotetraspora thailandica]|uniref:Pyridine nucleotide-disulfide oxidoreductase domain-containing protein 2 n=1 Tax=Planotetraspora thailandica TaxID=487172 RepID=A0A8J3XVS4_9ACTN|nr:NAD(P)/FAD-dependent oxidoreductase [Planotetraspora thailandica]GII56842.1 FAD-dependent oxidoreductase [Planotetraspora thailandica]